MPTYKTREFTHVIALTSITQGGITLVDGERYGYDEFIDIRKNWWELALDAGLVRIMNPIEYPEPQFPRGRLPGDRVFPARRYLLINTTLATEKQLKQLYRLDDVFGEPILNRGDDGKTRRVIIGVEIPYDRGDKLVIPAWITSNIGGIIVASGNQNQLNTFMQNNETYKFLHDIPREELVVVSLDREFGGGTL